MTEEEIKNHEDKISNKFLDDSFADSNAVSDEEKIPIVTEKNEEPIIVESTTIEENDIPEFEDSSSSELVDNSNMSSVAFGGAPIEDKNINEIK
jgi:primase-polymerase (primpol)-like protein